MRQLSKWEGHGLGYLRGCPLAAAAQESSRKPRIWPGEVYVLDELDETTADQKKAPQKAAIFCSHRNIPVMRWAESAPILPTALLYVQPSRIQRAELPSASPSISLLPPHGAWIASRAVRKKRVSWFRSGKSKYRQGMQSRGQQHTNQRCVVWIPRQVDCGTAVYIRLSQAYWPGAGKHCFSEALNHCTHERARA